MPTIELPQGRVHYRVAGPEDSSLPPVVLLHGILVDGELWAGVADALAAVGIRSYAPDLPLGAHPIALADDADLTPRGVARLVLDFLAALDLTDVTLVGLNYKDKREAALVWLSRHGNPYRASLLDADGRVGLDFGVYGVPETYVIDRDGVIRLKHTGAVTPEVVRDTLLPLIRQLEG